MNQFPSPSFWDQWGEAAIVIVVAAVLIFAIHHWFRAYRAKIASVTANRDNEGYQTLAEQVAVVVNKFRDERKANSEVLADVQRRLGAIEAILRQVD